jgi:hypothetical protein
VTGAEEAETGRATSGASAVVYRTTDGSRRFTAGGARIAGEQRLRKAEEHSGRGDAVIAMMPTVVSTTTRRPSIPSR